jgi:hypothetical protein
MSMLDGFSGYNHIMLKPYDQENKECTTPWGMPMYAKIPSGLMNVGENFQTAMEIAFSEEKDKFISIYLYYIIVYLNSESEHFQHLKQVFEKCRKFAISLNPKK